MTFLLRFTNRSLTDLAEIRAYIAINDPFRAESYALELRDKILSLQQMPRRCPVAPESAGRSQEIRHLIYESYRVLFTIKASQIIVLRVVHGARANIKTGKA